MLFAMNLRIVPGMFVCSSFLISVCMFIVSKALLISSATVIVREGGAIWLNPFATVLFTVCSAVTVECCVPVLRGCVWYVWYVCCYVQKKALLQCLAINERMDMDLYDVPLSMSLLDFGMWTMLASFYMCGIMLV